MVGEKFYRAGWEVEDHEGKFEGGVGEMQFFRGRVAEVAEKCRGRGGVELNRRSGGEGGRGWMEIWNLNRRLQSAQSRDREDGVG